MSETTYRVEFAKSGRSKCKKCKTAIAKDEIRLGVVVTGGDHDLQSWYHPICFNLPKRFVKGPDAMTVEEFVTNVLEDTTDTGTGILPDQKDEIVTAIGTKATTTTTTKSSPSSTSGGQQEEKKEESLMSIFAMEYKQMDKENKNKNKNKNKRKNDGGSDEENEDPQPSKKKFKGTPTEQAMFELYGKYYKNNLDQIKDILRYNRQVMVGTKEFLLFKIIDGEMNGRLARCSLCGGRLKIKDNDHTDTVICSGSFDEDTQIRINCAFTCKLDQAPRWKPWFLDEPTEEEKKKMDQLEAEIKGEENAGDGKESKSGDSSSKNNIHPKMEKKFQSLEWDVSNKVGIQTATKQFIKILLKNQEHHRLDLPINGDDDGKDTSQLRMEIGTIIVNNREELSKASSIPHAIYDMVVSKYGTVKDKQEKAKKKEIALEAMCKHPKNAPLMACFQELATLYFKDGNRNAGMTYTKVTNTIKDLDFEITTKNALGLGKGKTKVAGIGKSSAEKMHEFVSTGTIQKLEEKRADQS